MLVPLDAERYSTSAIATAAKLAARRRRGIHVLVLHRGAESRCRSTRRCRRPSAAARVDHRAGARCRAGARVTGHVEKVRAGQARAADRRGGARHARAGDRDAAAAAHDGASLFGKTLETVLAERPCRVIIESDAGRGAAAKRPITCSTTDRSSLCADMPEPRDLHRADDRPAVGDPGAARRRDDRPDARGGGGALAFGLLLGVLFIAAGVGPDLHRRAAARARAGADADARHAARPARAVRDRLHGGRRRLDLLLARRGRRPRARPDAGRSSSSAALFFALACDDLRRGRVAAPGARRARRSSPATRFNELVSFIAGWAICSTT